MEGVRRAVAELGKDAKPLRIQGFVKERFGIVMNTNTISTYKADIARKKAKAKAAPKPAAAANGQAEKLAPPPVTSAAFHRTNGKAAGIGLKDILAVKDLVTRVGANNLRTLIDVLSQ